jgi:hypothetical protein
MSLTRIQLNPHIHVLEANTVGNDLVIGDVHGNADSFKRWLDAIPAGSRGFCVGDLVDRGGQEVEVISAILKHNQDPSKGQVYSIRGNHEDMTLAAIHALEKNEENDDLKLHMLNGGDWLIELFNKEIDPKVGLIKCDDNGLITEYAANSQFKMIKDYMTSLPYILHVEGEKPFTLVHSDMPFDDNTLQYYIKRNQMLSDDQIRYSVWARMKTIHSDPNSNDIYMGDNNRNENSVLVLVGHNVVAHAIRDAVRKSTNTIDLDFMSWSTGSILSLNVTEGTCEWSGANTNVTDTEYIVQKRVIEFHLKAQLELRPFLADARKCEDMDELTVKLTTYATEKRNEAELLELAISHQCFDDDFIRCAMMVEEYRETLLFAKFDPNHTFKDGTTLLEYAMTDFHDPSFVCTLLDFGADVLAQKRYPVGETPYEIALKVGDDGLTKLIVQDLLLTAIVTKDAVLLSEVMQDGGDLFAKTREGESFFELAKEHGFLDETLDATLMTARNSPAEQDSCWNVMHLCALHANLETYKEMAKNGVNAYEVARIPLSALESMLSVAGASEVTMQKLADYVKTNPCDERGNIAITPNKLMKINLPEKTKTYSPGFQYAADKLANDQHQRPKNSAHDKPRIVTVNTPKKLM